MPKINVFDKIWSFVLPQAFQSVTWQTDWLIRVAPVIFLRERDSFQSIVYNYFCLE